MVWLFKESILKWMIKHPSSNQVSTFCCFSLDDKCPKDWSLFQHREIPPSKLLLHVLQASPAIHIPPALLSIRAALGSVLGLHLHILKNFSLGVRHFQQLIGAFEFKMESLSIYLTTLLAAKSNGLNYLEVTSENCNDSGILPRNFRN